MENDEIINKPLDHWLVRYKVKIFIFLIAVLVFNFFIFVPYRPAFLKVKAASEQYNDLKDIMVTGFAHLNNRLDILKYEQDSINKSEQIIFEHLPRIFPVDKKGYPKISSNYDWRVEPNGDTIYHRAIDISAPRGTEILASAAGIVIEAKYRNGNGNYTAIDSGNGIVVTYSHQDKILVQVGQVIKQGQVIGTVGNTGYSFGSHLHIEEFWDGKKVKPGAYWS
jgi:murein DD-endopeptidase MepM/ murein hydrolase activator NlpD